MNNVHIIIIGGFFIMQAIMETLFDSVYLLSVIIIGIIMMKNSKGNKQFFLFGFMSVLLGVGDAFHLIPRAYALCTIGLEANVVALGIGKFITSITMTIFYIILYHILINRYKLPTKTNLAYSIYILAIIRIVLCFFPQNAWTSLNSPVIWGVYRNIPFMIMGILIIILSFKQAKIHNDKNFKFMSPAIILSFALYIPVVLFAQVIPPIGMLMIPKTLAYVWIILMGFSEFKNANKL